MIPDELTTERLFLRPFIDGDGPAVYAYWKSDPGWERFNTSVPSDFGERDAGNFVTDMRRRNWRMQPGWALIHDEVVVGVVSLSFLDGHETATVGYGIHAALRGRGLCREAVTKVLDSAFAAYPELQEVCAHTDAENSASIRVLRKLGFSERCAISEDAHSAAGVTYGLLRAEWKG